MLPCLTKLFFGIPCPGCGGQRAVLFLIHGDFANAFFIYPAIYPLLIWAGLLLANLFFTVKNYGKLISIFSVLSVSAIIVNYGFELFYHF